MTPNVTTRFVCMRHLRVPLKTFPTETVSDRDESRSSHRRTCLPGTGLGRGTGEVSYSEVRSECSYGDGRHGRGGAGGEVGVPRDDLVIHAPPKTG